MQIVRIALALVSPLPFLALSLFAMAYWWPAIAMSARSMEAELVGTRLEDCICTGMLHRLPIILVQGAWGSMICLAIWNRWGAVKNKRIEVSECQSAD